MSNCAGRDLLPARQRTTAVPIEHRQRGRIRARLCRMIRRRCRHSTDRCAGDVTTIVGKALEKDKSRRYQSAAEMAADIRRHLRDEPITAVPPSTVYQVRKFARRNKGLVAGIALAFVLLICGITGTSIGLVRASVHWPPPIAAQPRCAAKPTRPRRSISSSTRCSPANPNSATVANWPHAGRDVKVVQLLDDASKQLDTGELTKQPAVEAAVRRTLGSTYGGAAEFPAAEQHVVVAAPDSS